MESSNPILSHRAFESIDNYQQPMTLQGTVNKTGILLSCVALTALGVWYMFTNTYTPINVLSLIQVGAIGGLILALITTFKKSWAPITAPIYAFFEGIALGSISLLFEMRYPGIALEAVTLTFGTLACLLVAYKTGFIRATEKFKLGIFAATGGIALTYFMLTLLSFFGISLLNGNTILSIGFSIFVVVIAALNLVVDFAIIEEAVAVGSPQYMEWYGAFGVMVTLIWLYLEILRLLSKMRKQK